MAALLCVWRSRSGNQCLESRHERPFGHTANPLVDDLPLTVKQEDMRLIAVAELPLEGVVSRIINIQIYKIDTIPPLLLKPVHDGSQTLAGRSPKGEELE